MENLGQLMNPFNDCYRDRRVLITGVTGFKGAWLASWLHRLGARLAGYADCIPTEPSLFAATGLEQRLQMTWGDVRDGAAVQAAFDAFQPEIVFHLAAQSLVARSYSEPVLTFETNVAGTANVLEAIRHTPSVAAGVIITSDKCYRNVEWEWGYREDDRLGGDDPYSASKAAAELIIHAYQASYFRTGAAISSVRAGNVIGGGDWADNRIVPDCARAWSRGERVAVRNPGATRPWQHVLEPLSGYLLTGSRLLGESDGIRGEAFNFGPPPGPGNTVAELIEALLRHWPGCAWDAMPATLVGKESHLLQLSSEKAMHRLAWRPTMTFAQTARLTAQWYNRYYCHQTPMADLTAQQLDEYEQLARTRHQPWISHED